MNGLESSTKMHSRRGKSEFWETSCHPWICTNQHKCVCWSPRGLTIPCTALWGLAKRIVLCESNRFPHFLHFVTLKRQETREPKSCSAPSKDCEMELGFENPCSCIWVSNSPAQLDSACQGCPCVLTSATLSPSLTAVSLPKSYTHSSDNWALVRHFTFPSVYQQWIIFEYAQAIYSKFLIHNLQMGRAGFIMHAEVRLELAPYLQAHFSRPRHSSDNFVVVIYILFLLMIVFPILNIQLYKLRSYKNWIYPLENKIFSSGDS